MFAMALTEHGNVSSHPRLEMAAKETGVKPIYGCELYTTITGQRTKKKNHLTVLAENAEGYRNLMRLVSNGWENFYYEPTVDGAAVRDHRDGLVVLSGCTGSLLATSLVGGKNVDPAEASYDRGRDVARRFRDVFGDAYYLEVQTFPELENTRNINTALERISRELSIPLVATGDVHYTRAKESEMQVILHAIRGGRATAEEQARSWGYDVKLSPPTSDERVIKKLVASGLSRKAAHEAIYNTLEIAQRCTVDLPRADMLRFPSDNGFKSSYEVWLAWLREGWLYRDISSKPNADEYLKRLAYEREVIEGKDFIDYFLVVSDAVRFAKDQGIPVGPARGSAAASLVCYLLRITEVDPMVHAHLIFERFIDVTRKDLPDIDLDFDDERRGELRKYLVDKYGDAHVGNIGSFVKYKAKNSLDDIARVYRIPRFETDQVKELLLERSSGDLRASATIEDTVEMFEAAADVFKRFPDLNKAMKLEGNVRGMSVHAAGLVVSTQPLSDICAVYSRKVKDEMTRVVSVDKYDAEYINLLKMDFLGLTTMGMLRRCLEMTGMTLNDLYNLPLDDPETIQGFRENDVVGVFQFDGRAMRLVNNDLKPDNFNEVCLVTALARPGPLHNNASNKYSDIKNNRAEPERLHPLYDRIVEDTNFEVVYQEQILRIVREIGGFDWTAAAYIRRIISRKIGEQEFNRQWENFRVGAKKNGVPPDVAKIVWGKCITAGAYAFNLAHSVSYGMIAYWTMYFKRHHPLVFFTASLQKYNEEKQKELLRDGVKHGIKFMAPHPVKSEINWRLSKKDDAIVAGFSKIDGIGVKTAEAIIAMRKQLGRKMRWDDLIEVKGIGPKTLERIIAWVNQKDPLGIYIMRNRIRRATKDIQLGKLRGAANQQLPLPTHKSGQVPYGRTKDDVPVVWLGTIVHRNLRDLYEVNFARTGVPLDPKEVKDPDLKEWVLLQGVDDDDIITITIDRWKYPRFKKAVWELKPGKDLVLIQGIKKAWLPNRVIYANKMWVF